MTIDTNSAILAENENSSVYDNYTNAQQTSHDIGVLINFE